MAGGRVARIFVAETQGVVLPQITAEAVRDLITDINHCDGRDYHEPASLDEATSIISKALSSAS